MNKTKNYPRAIFWTAHWITWGFTVIGMIWNDSATRSYFALYALASVPLGMMMLAARTDDLETRLNDANHDRERDRKWHVERLEALEKLNGIDPYKKKEN